MLVKKAMKMKIFMKFQNLLGNTFLKTETEVMINFLSIVTLFQTQIQKLATSSFSD